MSKNSYQCFVEAIKKDCKCSFQDADELATDFAIDFAKTADKYDIEHQREVWNRFVDEFWLGDEVEALTERFYDGDLFKDIIEIGEIARQ